MTVYDRQVDYSRNEPPPNDLKGSYKAQLLISERNLLQRGVTQAKQLWPNMFGAWVASELNALTRIGLRFDEHGNLKKMLESLNSMYLDEVQKGNLPDGKN